MKWTPEADDALTTLFQNNYTDDEIADYFNMESTQAVVFRRNKLGLFRRKTKHIPWTEADNEKLRTMCHLSVSEAAAALGRTQHAVTAQRKNLGLKSTKSMYWEPWQEAIMLAEYETCPRLGPLAAKLGKTVRQVASKGYNMGLKRRNV